MTRTERAAAIALLAATALTAGIAVRQWQIASAPSPAAQMAADQLRTVRLADADGQWRQLSDWNGKLLVVNYWATWCPPCTEEMPAFARLNRKYRDAGVQFVGISIDSVDKIREFRIAASIDYPLLVGTMELMQATSALGNEARALPFTMIIDSTGRLRETHLGRYHESNLEQRIQQLLAAPQKPSS